MASSAQPNPDECSPLSQITALLSSTICSSVAGFFLVSGTPRTFTLTRLVDAAMSFYAKPATLAALDDIASIM
jgi:hypothetical protein